MKKLAFKIAAVLLLLTIGCSKDNLIDTEQTPFSVEENDQIKNGEIVSYPVDRFGYTNFLSNSIENGKFLQGCLPTGRNLLKFGKFSGSLSGYGKINSNLSTYEFIACNVVPIDSPPNYGEPLMYSVIANGTIFIGTKDNCTITIKGNIYPWYYTSYGFDGGLFIGTATTHSGKGKLINFNKTFKVYSNSVIAPGINIEKGTINLSFSDYGL